MVSPVTDYFRPKTLDAALQVLRRGSVTIAAGCTDLFPVTEQQELSGSVLDITGIAGLAGIDRTDTGWRIGAATPWSAFATADLPPAFDMLAEAAREVGAIQIQNLGTVGGNICNASPAADGIPPLLALDAQVELASVDGVRRLPLAEFVTGVRRTELAWDELLSAILIPDAATKGHSGFSKLGARSSLVISIVMVAARMSVENGNVAEAAISVGACSPVARRLTALEQHLLGQNVNALDIPADLVRGALDPIDDVRGDRGYRLDVAETMVRRLVTRVAGGAA